LPDWQLQPISNQHPSLSQRVKKRGVALSGQLENVAQFFYFETKRVDIFPVELGPCGQFGLDLNRLSYRVGGHLPIRHPLIPGVKFFANSLGASLQLPPQILSTVHNGLVKFDDVLCAMAAEIFEQLHKAFVFATAFERGCKPYENVHIPHVTRRLSRGLQPFDKAFTGFFLVKD
jgi:hypothetical protein